MAKIAVLGTGGFGIALAVLCEREGHDVVLWGKFSDEVAAVRRDREHKQLLPGVVLPEKILVTDAIADVADAALALIATPSFAVRETAARLREVDTTQMCVSCVAKGLEQLSGKLFSDVIAEELPGIDPVILSGPSHAEEIACAVPTTVVAASRNRENAEFVQDLLTGGTLRIYVSDDLIGVQLGGALKNIIAVCAGISDGLALGDNAKAALMTRGLAEIARLGTALGADSTTFAGLTGIGDLIVTCTSIHSRNYRTGKLIGQGVAPAEAIRQIGMTVEGCNVTETAYRLAQAHGVPMPIVEQLYLVLRGEKTPRQAVMDLMARPKRHENESIWLQEQREERK